MVKSPAPNILICCFFFLIAVLSLPVDQALSADTRPGSWAFLGGYGQSYPGWGQTTQRVETIDLIPRYNHIVFDEIGSGWYKGFHSTLFEFPVSLILNPEISSMIGIITYPTLERRSPTNRSTPQNLLLALHSKRLELAFQHAVYPSSQIW